ncbi:MAG TPA: AI-2E family transporter [Verrucomicrobiae bacterium]|nr:AI-2E family transporter [Verrucomicrobiae bacterium]
MTRRRRRNSGPAEAAAEIPKTNSHEISDSNLPLQGSLPAPVKWEVVFVGILAVFAAIAFLYLAEVVLMPVVLAWVAGMALKPVIRCSSEIGVPPKLGAAVVLLVFVLAAGFGVIRLSQPAIEWAQDTPRHMTQLRERVQRIFQPAARLGQVAAEVSKLGTSDDGQPKAAPVEIKDNHAASTVIDWTGSLLVRIGETLVLSYLLLAAGDRFLQKMVRVMPTLHDKRRAVEITREIQQNISSYLFSVSMINVGVGVIVGTGFYFMGVPNAAMWGVLAAFLNYVPYFGPIAGIILLGIVGLLSFDNLTRELLPAAWYLLVHLLEANLITPILLGRRFTMNPVVIFVSLMFWTWLWGVPGALLSVPILMSLKSVCERVPALSPIGEYLED